MRNPYSLKVSFVPISETFVRTGNSVYSLTILEIKIFVLMRTAGFLTDKVQISHHHLSPLR